VCLALDALTLSVRITMVSFTLREDRNSCGSHEAPGRLWLRLIAITVDWGVSLEEYCTNQVQ
jgi:hypothetical protein